MTWRAGTVYLVGAGPGDPGLITVRGHELLEHADVVIFDRLIGIELLELVPPNAVRIDAGKRPGQQTMTQEAINAALVEHAQARRIVVRLKGGDPFIFGRGSEEAEACAQAGVPCEIVPGVTSAIAAPAAAGIPLTERGIARHAAIVTAQTGEAGEAVDWAALAGLDTIAILMGRGGAREACEALIACGRKPGTPAAAVERGTMPGQREVFATLGTLPEALDRGEVRAPVVIVVGEVARRRTAGGAGADLAGRRIVVTRPRAASGELARLLREHGATVIDCPLISIEPIEVPADRMRAVLRPAPAWIVTTSRHGSMGLVRALRGAGLDGRSLVGSKLAAVGPTTGSALRAGGLEPDLVPTVHRASGLIEAIGRAGSESARVLFVGGSLARDELPRGLVANGWCVDVLTVYETRTLMPDERTRSAIERGVDAVLLASPSAARAWSEAGLSRGESCGAIPAFIAIGPTTAAGARAVGISCSAVAAAHCDAGLVRAAVDTLGGAP